MVFEEELFQKLLKSSKKNTVLVKEAKNLPKKDFKAMVKKNKIAKIGVNLFKRGCCSLFPLYRLSNEFYRLWLTQIDKFILQGKVHLYAEDALNEILNHVELEPVYFDKELCREVDNAFDLETVKQLLLDKHIGRASNNEN